MKLGVLTNLLGSVSLEEALKYFSSLGLEMVEIGCGGFPGKAHADPDVLLNDDKALADFKALLEKYNAEAVFVDNDNNIHAVSIQPHQVKVIEKGNPKLEENHLYITIDDFAAFINNQKTSVEIND